MNSSHPPSTANNLAAGKLLGSALRTLELEKQGISALARELDGDLGIKFEEAIQLIAQKQQANGRLILTGMGKSGHIAQKLAATLASTGSPAFFVHPSEASHGDLGMITTLDVIVALSWSGETIELKPMIDYAARFNVALVSICSNPHSALAQASAIALILPKSVEACPHGLAPTTSTTMQLVMGDALAIALLEHKGFSASDFKVFHPGGALGASLSYVRDLMHEGDEMPLIPALMEMSEALPIMSQKGFGCLGVLDGQERLAGIITDGDLRRNMSPRLIGMKAEEVMTIAPKTISPGELASKALEMINAMNITTLFVVDDEFHPLGIIHLHDLLRAKIA